MHKIHFPTIVVSTKASSLRTQGDIIMTTNLAQSSKHYESTTKRRCPFAHSPLEKKHRRPDYDIRELQQDVEELETKMEAVRRRKAPSLCKKVDAVRLRAMLQACRNQVNKTSAFHGGYYGVSLEYDQKNDEPVYRRMAASVENLYKQQAQIFSDACLNDRKTDFQDARVITNAKEGTFVRFVIAKIAPFTFDFTSRGLWNCIKKHSVLDRTDIDHEDPNIMYLKRQYMFQDKCTAIPVHLRAVIRRFEEPNRTVVVWDGMGEWPTNESGSRKSNIPIMERGYIVLQPSHRGPKATPVSLLQTCIYMTPGLSPEIDMDQPDCLDMLSKVVIPSYGKIIDAREQVLENAILDEMIQSKSI